MPNCSDTLSTLLPRPSALTDFEAQPLEAGVALSWAEPAFFDRIVVRRAIGSFPDSAENGTLVYAGKGTMAQDGGLTNGTSYLYSAFVMKEGRASIPMNAKAMPAKECPSNYVWAMPNTSLGISEDFCVAKYEMKCAADATGMACVGPALSQPENQPWQAISQVDAKTECANLGIRYHLISNAEWMTMAREIENDSQNWSSGSAGVGTLNRGHSDTGPAATLAASTNDDENCYQTGQGSGEVCNVFDLQTRTHVLSSQQIIWDVAGNAREWVDWNVTPAQKAYVAIDAGPVDALRSFTDVDALVGPANEMYGPIWLPQRSFLNETHGVGQYYAGATGGGAAIRGGAYNSNTSAGVYAISVDRNQAYATVNLSFRCAYK